MEGGGGRFGKFGVNGLVLFIWSLFVQYFGFSCKIGLLSLSIPCILLYSLDMIF